MATPRLFLARHAETEWNVAHRMQGREDSPLTAQGIAQAEALGESARALAVRHVCTSPLGRARATSELVARACGAEVSVHAALAELSFGEAAGGTIEQARARWPRWWAERERARWATRWPAGESYADAEARLGAWLAQGEPPWTSTSTLVLAHQSVLRAFLVAALAWPIERALEARFEACELVEAAGGEPLRPHPPSTPAGRS